MTITPTRACGCPEGRSFMSRRGFMSLAGATGLITATTLGGARVGLLPGASAADVDADILVVLVLGGGFDGCSAVVAHGDPALAASRGSIAIPTGRLKMVDSMFGLHPAMAPLFPLWDAGKVAAVHAVGMANPNRSHFDAMEEMETAAPGSSLRTGWIDRTVGLIDSDAFAAGTFTATMVGSSTIPRSLAGPNPEMVMRSVEDIQLLYDNKIVPVSAWQGALGTLHAGAAPAVSQPTMRGFAAVSDLAPDLAAAVATDVPPAPAAGLTYPDTAFGRALGDIARLVKKQVGLRVATVDQGNGSWDMHSNFGDTDTGQFANDLTSLTTAMAVFAEDLGDDFNRVTLVTLSEFGRSINVNGSGGIDHGYGNAVLMMGGGLKGGKVYGTWPGLTDEARVGGDLAVTTDYRSVIAEILSTRCRVSNVAGIFPGLSQTPLGFTNVRT